MDSGKTFLKIKELGHTNSKREELRDYCKLKFDEIIKCLSRRIMNNDGADLLDCIFIGIPDDGSSHTNKVKIIDIVLRTMRKESASLTHCGEVISRVCLELPRQPVLDLVKWCDDCVQSIIDDSDVNMIWRDVLPECLNTIVSHDCVKHCGTDMTGADYKVQCIRTLCQCRWTQRQLVQLAAMFKDMQLTKNDHRQVVNKICSHIMDISPEGLPPLVHQLLKLCKLYNVEIVLAQLSHYFNLYLYSKLEPAPQDSETTTVDIDNFVQYSPAVLSSCLSTCIYHITQGAAQPELIRKHIKMWPKTQLLRAPFLVDVALVLCNKGADFRSICLDAIKSAIEQRAFDELRSKHCAWVRSVMQPDVDVASVLKVITTESANHRELTVLGLINLAFALLSVSRLKQSAPVCWSHGKLILVRLCKFQPETAGHILSQLADRLSGDSTQRQYSECFHVLCKLSPVSVERCTQVASILESCQPSPTEYESAAQVLDAVHPLLNFSTRTRDALVMVCRKGLYSRDSLHRCLSLSGFLTVLRHIKLSSGSLSGSQGAASEYSSAHSYLTQLTVDIHATQQGASVTSRVRNETMCLEVVSILRRCLVQDAAVKQLLYTQLYNCVREKPALHESVLELLYEHLCKYLPDEEDGDALLLDRCIQMTAITSSLIEPISRLLYVIAQFLQLGDEDLEDILASQNVDTGSAHLKSKLNNIIEKLIRSDFATVDMAEHGLVDLTPESKAKCLKVQQILQCHEALIAHQVMQWNVSSKNIAGSVYKLFKACNELLEQTKTPTKSSKKINKTNLNETKDTAKSQKSQKSQKDKGKGPNKLSNMVKERAGPFKPLPCIWDLKFCLRLLDLLYSEEVSWSSIEQRNMLRARRDFHRWALRNVIGVLNERVDKSSVPTTVVGIASLMYKRCICRFQDMCEFDDQTALSCLDVFKSCLNLILSKNYSFKMEALFPNITGPTVTTATGGVAAMLEHSYDALVQLEAEGAEEDADATAKKILTALCQLTTILLEIPLQSSADINRVIIKLEEYLRTSKQDCLQLVAPLLDASCRENQEAQLLDELLTKLTTALGRIDEEECSSVEESESFPIIDSRTGHAALNQVCAHLSHRFKSVEQLLVRARDLSAAMEYAAPPQQQRIDREVTDVYKSLIVQLCQLSRWTGSVSRLRCGVGAGSERVLSACVRLYTLLAALVKQLPPALAIALRLERLLKLCGKKLSAAMDCLITYVEQSQRPQAGRANKVLRECRLVPRLVLEAEQFIKHAMLLATKAKVNYQQYLPFGTARDFRIKAPVLEKMLKAVEQAADDDEVNDEQDIDDAATDIILPASDNEEENGSDNESNVRKRRRVS